jgi:hypothetical protein
VPDRDKKSQECILSKQSSEECFIQGASYHTYCMSVQSWDILSYTDINVLEHIIIGMYRLGTLSQECTVPSRDICKTQHLEGGPCHGPVGLHPHPGHRPPDHSTCSNVYFQCKNLKNKKNRTRSKFAL